MAIYSLYPFGYNKVVTMIIAEKLREMRTSKGITQHQLADIAGVELITYGRYERGERIPPSDVLSKIADGLSCTTDYLLGRTDEPNLVHFDTGVDYEGDRIYLDIVKEYIDKGLTKEEIDEFIQMGLAWKEARDKIKKKPRKT